MRYSGMEFWGAWSEEHGAGSRESEVGRLPEKDNLPTYQPRRSQESADFQLPCNPLLQRKSPINLGR